MNTYPLEGEIIPLGAYKGQAWCMATRRYLETLLKHQQATDVTYSPTYRKFLKDAALELAWRTNHKETNE